MDHTDNPIYHPANTSETLPLPLALRYFEAEPCWRSEAPEFALRDADERLHCDDGVAVQFEDGATEYWWHGRAHRERGLPAIYITDTNAIELPLGSSERYIVPDALRLNPGSEICCVDGLIHCDDGAAICNHGDEDTYCMEYWFRGRRHCSNGPAVETMEWELWYYHGLLHREDGPACKAKRRKGSKHTCYWYGRKLAFDEPLAYDFPTDEPPPALVLHALAHSEFCPDFEDERVVSMIWRASTAMPELAVLVGVIDDATWESIRAAVWTFLHEPEKYRSQTSDTIPLPDGIGEDDFQQAGDVVVDRKVA